MAPGSRADAALAARAAANADSADKRRYVQTIFSEIAPRYDLLNHVLSLNIDRRWRRRAISELGWTVRPDGTYVDLCAGTLDVSAMLARQPGFRGSIVAADFAEPMLRAGAGKTPRAVTSPVVADALDLPVRDGGAAGAIVAFGIRNVANLDACLREVRRTLAPGARFVILEFGTPSSGVVRTFYHLYFHHVLPLLGGIVSGHPTAYRYLPKSVSNFPDGDDLASRMTAAGFAGVRWQRLSSGIAAIHVGTRA